MRKKVFIISWFYLIGAVIMTLLPIICIFLTLPHSNDELFVCSFLIVLFSLASIFFFIVFGFTFIQWVVITENEIVAKCLFGTIRRTDWKDVKEIMIMPLSYQPLNPKTDWFVFVDKLNGILYHKSPFNFKGRYIKIKTSKKNRKFLETLKPNIKFTLYKNE